MEYTFNILQIGKARLRPGGWHLPVPSRPYWRFYWVDRPGCSVTHQGQTYHLIPRQVALIAPNTEFSGKIEQPLTQLFIHFTRGPLHMISNTVFIWEDEPWIDELADLAISFHGRKEFNRKTGLTFLRFIVQAIAKIPDHLLNQEITDPRFKTMLSLMQKNFRHPLTNEELAQEINMSTRAMIRTFKGIFGCTPQAFYLRLRLEHALLLLEFSQHSIEVIAEQCGFCDRNYFSTAFKRHFAISPAAYRRKNRFHV